MIPSHTVKYLFSCLFLEKQQCSDAQGFKPLLQNGGHFHQVHDITFWKNLTQMKLKIRLYTVCTIHVAEMQHWP